MLLDELNLHPTARMGAKMMSSMLYKSLALKSELLINCLRGFRTTCEQSQIQKLTRFRVVDNSNIGRAAELAGKPAKCIHVYNKTGIGFIGDKVLVAIQGQKKRAYVVGLRQKQKPFVPRFDTNNIVLVEDNGTPTGTRIRVPIPSCLRGQKGDFTKILAIATKFV